jgi:hypothetical protein
MGEVADEGAGGLRAWAFRTVEIGRQADDETADLMLGGKVEEARHVERKLAAADGLERRCNRAQHVGEREAECLGSDINADQTCAGLERGVKGLESERRAGAGRLRFVGMHEELIVSWNVQSQRTSNVRETCP